LKNLNTHYTSGWRPFHLTTAGQTGTFVPHLLANSVHHTQPYLFLNEASLEESYNDSTVLAFLFTNPQVVVTLNKNLGNEFGINVRSQTVIKQFQELFAGVTDETARANLKSFAQLSQIPLEEPKPEVKPEVKPQANSGETANNADQGKTA
jgi:hypothetical protein